MPAAGSAQPLAVSAVTRTVRSRTGQATESHQRRDPGHGCTYGEDAARGEACLRCQSTLGDCRPVARAAVDEARPRSTETPLPPSMSPRTPAAVRQPPALNAVRRALARLRETAPLAAVPAARRRHAVPPAPTRLV